MAMNSVLHIKRGWLQGNFPILLMSYASVAATNAPPPSEQVTHLINTCAHITKLTRQPHPDQGLLNTTPPTAGSVVDDMSKVNVVSPNYKSHPATFTSEANIGYDDDDDDPLPGINPSKKKKVNKRLQEAEAEGIYLWEVTKHYLLRPGIAGGLVGLSKL